MKSFLGGSAAKGHLASGKNRPAQNNNCNTNEMKSLLGKGAHAFSSDLDSPDISLDQGTPPQKSETCKKKESVVERGPTTAGPVLSNKEAVLLPSELDAPSSTGKIRNLQEQKPSAGDATLTGMLSVRDSENRSNDIRYEAASRKSSQVSSYGIAQRAFSQMEHGKQDDFAVPVPFTDQRKITITATKTHVFKGDLMTKLDFDLSFPKACKAKDVKDPYIYARLMYTTDRATRPIAASYRFLFGRAPKRSDEFRDSYTGIYDQFDNNGPPKALEVVLCGEAFVSHPDPQANSDCRPSLDHASVQTLALEVFLYDADKHPLGYSISRPIFVTEFGLSIEALFDEAPFMIKMVANDMYPNEAVYAWHNKAGGENAGIYVKLHLRDAKGRVVKDHTEPLKLRTELVYNDLSVCPKMPIYPLKRKPAQSEDPHPLFRRLRDDPILEPYQGNVNFCFRIEEVSTTHAQTGGPGKSGFKLKVSIHENSIYRELISPGYMDETIVVRSKARKEDLGAFPYQEALNYFRKEQDVPTNVESKPDKPPTPKEKESKKPAARDIRSKKRKAKVIQKSDTPLPAKKSGKNDQLLDLPSVMESPDLCATLVLENGHCLWCKSVVTHETFRDVHNHTQDCIFSKTVIQGGIDHAKEHAQFGPSSSFTPGRKGLSPGYTPIQHLQNIYQDGFTTSSTVALLSTAFEDSPEFPELEPPSKFDNSARGIQSYPQMPPLSLYSFSAGDAACTLKTGLSPKDIPGNFLSRLGEVHGSRLPQPQGMLIRQKVSGNTRKNNVSGGILFSPESEGRDDIHTKAKANKFDEDPIPDDALRDCDTPSSAENVDVEVQIDDNIWDTEFTKNASRVSRTNSKSPDVELCAQSVLIKKEEELNNSFEAV